MMLSRVGVLIQVLLATCGGVPGSAVAICTPPPSIPLALHTQATTVQVQARVTKKGGSTGKGGPASGRKTLRYELQHSALPAQIWHTPTKISSLAVDDGVHSRHNQMLSNTVISHDALALPLCCCACSERAGWWGPTGGADSKLSPWYGPDRNRVSLSRPAQHEWR